MGARLSESSVRAALLERARSTTIIARFTFALALVVPAALMGQRPATAPPADTASPCVGCPSSTHPARALSSAIVFELIPYGYNRWIDHTDWSKNLRDGWGWDDDHFAVNQFAHPYSGNLFYNSARTNGYGFRGAAPYAFAGSVLWEYFGETTRPSINDLINTTLGGITLGETTYRLSSMILDARTTGMTRVVREVSAALVDPPRAFGRLMDGDVWRIGSNPRDRIPSSVISEVQVGYQRLTHGRARSPLRGLDQPFASYSLAYGDPMGRDTSEQFSSFRLDGALGGAASGALSELRATGFLAVRELRGDSTTHHRVALTMNYHYYNNAAFVSGGQGFSGIFLSRFPLGALNTMRTELWATGMALGAVRSDYSASPAAIANETARDYDYGPGVSARGQARFEHAGRTTVAGSYEATWLRVVSGTARHQDYQTFSLRAETGVTRHLSLGASEQLFNRTGFYAAHPTVRARDAQTRAYLAFRI